MKLLIATRNQSKTREIRDIFAGLPFQLVFPPELYLERLPEEQDLEQGTSLAENAVAKARYFAKRSNLPTLAEDSGLEVDALDGAPGVFSARWSLMHGQEARVQRDGGLEAANNALLLERLAGVPDDQRTARYRCVVAYVESAIAKPELVEATCEGRILAEPRGSGGFGYDPFFFSSELQMTFAEAPLPAKQRVSHRGRAIRALIEVLLRRAQ
ncbi:MAG TPA: RdgB/HAM1 family non-canonical purine NTP pyrophosphatase [Gemmatimonadales bacterium]|nr:RdgB/HAM1 family non-canonical purine NTP pyrophosphatase [Gemmatimonadales bacterium]